MVLNNGISMVNGIELMALHSNMQMDINNGGYTDKDIQKTYTD
jgi:hypothetical protein